MTEIFEQVVRYNLYNANDKLVGETEITAPSFEQMTNTISGAGIMGEYEAPIPGMFSSAEVEIPFRVFDREAAKLLKSSSMLYLRACVEGVDSSTHQTKKVQLKIAMNGRPKGVTIGTIGNGKTMDSSVKMELTYYKHEFDGRTLFELDKLNGKHVVDGEDQMAEINSMI